LLGITRPEFIQLLIQTLENRLNEAIPELSDNSAEQMPGKMVFGLAFFLR
jgi:hypothetical protein